LSLDYSKIRLRPVGVERRVGYQRDNAVIFVRAKGARDQVRQTVTLGILDSSLRLKNARSAVVTVQIVPAPMERILRSRPIHLRNVSSGLVAQAEPASVDVTLRGSREALGRFESDEVSAYVDLGGLGAGTYQLPVHTEVARDAGVTRIEPAMVQIRITSGQ